MIHSSQSAPRCLRHLCAAFATALVLMVVMACTGSKTELSGTYEAKDKDGSMALEFKSGGKVRMSMMETGGKPDTKEADYMIDGNKVTIQVPDGIPLSLVKNGDSLEGSFMGQIVHFNKK
jgi:hypothetical protein